MKNRINSISIIIMMVSGIVLSSCKDDFLNTKPLGEVEGGTTWKDAALSEAFVTGIYGGLGAGGFNEEMLASASDESLFTHSGRGFNRVNESSITDDDLAWFNRQDLYRYDRMYGRIRACNIALMNLEKPAFDDPIMASRLKGEALFLRAYYYHQLVRLFGGVPLIDKPYETGSADYTVARNTFEESVNFIIKDLDAAAVLLQGKNTGQGRASRDAALAIKSRILLYAASDLHDMPTAKSKSGIISSFAKPELLGYVSGNRTARWTAAKAAAKAVLDLPYGYKLNLSSPASSAEGSANYLSIAMGGGSAAPGIDKSASNELIFGRYFIIIKEEGAQRMGRNLGPNGYHNWAGSTPVQNLVDDYEMMDGTKFDWTDPAKVKDIYTNRDPRFKATFLYDGADWKPRTSNVAGIDPFNQIQTGVYEVGTFGAAKTFNGLDARQSSIENWNGSWTGYYFRKFIDPDPAIVDRDHKQFIPWPFFRYTEAVFNYAEACIELGEEAEARTWLNKIRFRAGMPAITETGLALKNRYRNERRVEMVYEEQRFYDARRWMIAPTTLGNKAVIIKVQGKLKPGKTVAIYKRSDNDYNYTYTPEVTGLENRSWNDKMYFLPMSRAEIGRNNKLIQNPGY
ncbi:MAG: RagB/SusD family nutrient uptake outer membrane protein [Bacteroidota bacterium]